MNHLQMVYYYETICKKCRELKNTKYIVEGKKCDSANIQITDDEDKLFKTPLTKSLFIECKKGGWYRE